MGIPHLFAQVHIASLLTAIHCNVWNNDTPLLCKVDCIKPEVQTNLQWGLVIERVLQTNLQRGLSLILESLADQLTVMPVEEVVHYKTAFQTHRCLVVDLQDYGNTSAYLICSTRINITLPLSPQSDSNQEDASASQVSRNSTLCWFMSWHINHEWQPGLTVYGYTMNQLHTPPRDHEPNFWHLWA